MSLTTAQLAALKADILADGTLAAKANNSDGNTDIAIAYNATAVPDFFVWRTDAPVRDIYDAITWANYTPNDAPDGTALFTNRALVIQTKQMNLQNMLQGRQSIDSSKVNIRAGLRDAVISIPSGTGGAAVAAGGASGATVLTACLRKATRAEKLFNTGNSSTGGVTGALFGFEGSLAYQDVQAARDS
jgi:hypothetical protein